MTDIDTAAIRAELADPNMSCSTAFTRLQHCVDALDAARADLLEAIELAEEVIPYAGEYFREKWDLDKRLVELKGRT